MDAKWSACLSPWGHQRATWSPRVYPGTCTGLDSSKSSSSQAGENNGVFPQASPVMMLIISAAWLK